MALAHLGESQISSIIDDNARARACNLHLVDVRDQVLRSHRWNCAQTRAVLQPVWVTMTSVADSSGIIQVTKTAHGLLDGMGVTTDDTGADGVYVVDAISSSTFTLVDSVWSASVVAGRYRKSAPFGWDYLYALPGNCLRVLEVNDSEVGDVISDEFIIEGRDILTNADEVRLVYTKQISDNLFYDPLFAEALALKLAITLTEKIRGTTGKTADLLQQYERITAPLARRVDANEGRRRKGLISTNSLAIRARGEGV